MLNRRLAPRILAAKKSVLLLGPRQTGKSTLVLGLQPDMEVNLARESEFLAFSSSPAELEQRIAATTPSTVFVDEVQRLPSLLNTIQATVDASKRSGRPIKFYLTGSSARKLKRGEANLLPGRVFLYTLGPLTAMEVGDQFDVRRAMALGTLPEPYLEEDRAAAEKLLSSYAGVYLKEEVQAETVSRNIEGFSRFLTIAAASSGLLLDYSKLAQQAHVSRSSTVRYFELLEETLLVYRVAPYPHAPDADLVKHPKFYFFDPGVLNGLLGNFSVSGDRSGLLFEHLVVSQLRATAMAHDVPLELHTFRTRGGLEVDLIASVGGRTWAIEVKAGAVQARDGHALVAARAYLPTATRSVVVIPSGTARRFDTDVEVLPLARLLEEVF